MEATTVPIHIQDQSRELATYLLHDWAPFGLPHRVGVAATQVRYFAHDRGAISLVVQYMEDELERAQPEFLQELPSLGFRCHFSFLSPFPDFKNLIYL